MVSVTNPQSDEGNMTTAAERAAEYEAWLTQKEAEGYRVRDVFETDSKGRKTFAGMMDSQDAYVHNVTISLRAALDATEPGTPAHEAVKTLYHDIVAQALGTYHWLDVQKRNHQTLLKEIAELMGLKAA
jgi:hypothetical protein